jgi:hypothetical protein
MAIAAGSASLLAVALMAGQATDAFVDADGGAVVAVAPPAWRKCCRHIKQKRS